MLVPIISVQNSLAIPGVPLNVMPAMDRFCTNCCRLNSASISSISSTYSIQKGLPAWPNRKQAIWILFIFYIFTSEIHVYNITGMFCHVTVFNKYIVLCTCVISLLWHHAIVTDCSDRSNPGQICDRNSQILYRNECVFRLFMRSGSSEIQVKIVFT